MRSQVRPTLEAHYPGEGSCKQRQKKREITFLENKTKTKGPIVYPVDGKTPLEMLVVTMKRPDVGLKFQPVPCGNNLVYIHAFMGKIWSTTSQRCFSLPFVF
jgi:hypothetical protein